MLDPKLLQALAAVVENGGFDKAAKALFLTQSAVSQRIKQLEERLGQPVVTRTTPIDATPHGRHLIQHFRQLTLMEAELMETLQAGDGHAGFSTLAVAVNADSLATWFLDAARPALETDRLLLDIRVDDQEHTHELLRSGHVSGCVSSRSQTIQGGESHYLGSMRYLCLAAPGFIARHFADGISPTTLSAAPALLFDRKDSLHQSFLQQQLAFSLDFPALTLPSVQGFLDYTLAGIAYSLIPEGMAAPALADGRLVDLAPGKYLDVPLYWHHWQMEVALARRLTATIVEQGRNVLRQYPNNHLA
ncbi:MAG TPA: LysR family transcriptional regulator ArgP [Pseudogulbenkiania sp.]|nr:LysR family transcriptional regulator ArgP [Pseudogulbenkiania sp.]